MYREPAAFSRFSIAGRLRGPARRWFALTCVWAGVLGVWGVAMLGSGPHHLGHPGIEVGRIFAIGALCLAGVQLLFAVHRLRVRPADILAHQLAPFGDFERVFAELEAEMDRDSKQIGPVVVSASWIVYTHSLGVDVLRTADVIDAEPFAHAQSARGPVPGTAGVNLYLRAEPRALLTVPLADADIAILVEELGRLRPIAPA